MVQNRLEEKRLARGYTREKLADLTGTSVNFIYRKEKGYRKFEWDDAQLFAPHLGCPPEELMGGAVKELTHVQVVRYLRKLAITEKAGSAQEMVACPAGLDPKTTEATKVIGDANEPTLFDGGYVFNGPFFPGVPPEYIGKLCVVELEDNSTIAIARIRKSDGIGRYDLIPFGYKEPIMKSQLIARAARVLSIVPD